MSLVAAIVTVIVGDLCYPGDINMIIIIPDITAVKDGITMIPIVFLFIILFYRYFVYYDFNFIILLKYQ